MLGLSKFCQRATVYVLQHVKQYGMKASNFWEMQTIFCIPLISNRDMWEQPNDRLCQYYRCKHICFVFTISSYENKME
uniref:Uncharacterized protein n=1 Tax=Arion vulgaris TaxID=1028688 RepID=A0A0B7BDI1_9EUPU